MVLSAYKEPPIDPEDSLYPEGSGVERLLEWPFATPPPGDQQSAREDRGCLRTPFGAPPVGTVRSDRLVRDRLAWAYWLGP